MPSTDNKIQIELFPAGNGDALLIKLGKIYLLIDTGYPSTYQNHLKTRLKKLGGQGAHLAKLIITHIDADHISGAIPLLEENGPAHAPNIIPIDEIWHNSYRHLQFAEKEDGIFLDGLPDVRLPAVIHEDDADLSGGDVSYQQGSTLGAAILKGKYPWNMDFAQQAVMADDPKKLALESGVVLTLLGPTTCALNTLADKWLKDLRKRYKDKINKDNFFDDAFERLLEQEEKPRLGGAADVAGGTDYIQQHLAEWDANKDEDHSVTNGSSITFLLEYNRKKMLFLGDAIPSLVIEQLKKIAPLGQLPIEVDVLKVAHHGGFTNNSPALLKSIQAKTYLFSSNGKRYRHPHLETIAWILEQHKNSPKNLVFNYPQARLEILQHEILKKRYQYEVKMGDKNGYCKLEL